MDILCTISTFYHSIFYTLYYPTVWRKICNKSVITGERLEIYLLTTKYRHMILIDMPNPFEDELNRAAAELADKERMKKVEKARLELEKSRAEKRIQEFKDMPLLPYIAQALNFLKDLNINVFEADYDYLTQLKDKELKERFGIFPLVSDEVSGYKQYPYYSARIVISKLGQINVVPLLLANNSVDRALRALNGLNKDMTIVNNIGITALFMPYNEYGSIITKEIVTLNNKNIIPVIRSHMVKLIRQGVKLTNS